MMIELPADFPHDPPKGNIILYIPMSLMSSNVMLYVFALLIMLLSPILILRLSLSGDFTTSRSESYYAPYQL